jgi:hypothetical protein
MRWFWGSYGGKWLMMIPFLVAAVIASAFPSRDRLLVTVIVLALLGALYVIARQRIKRD